MGNAIRKPKRRKRNLAVQSLGDEVLVYDLERHRAHCLNKTAALIWNRCDGETSISEIAASLKDELDLAPDPELVRYALGRLAKAHLLETAPAGSQYSRRDFMARLKKLGLAASMALPVVSSIVSPTPAHALSCVSANMCGAAGNCTPCYQGNPGQCGARMCCNGSCRPANQARSDCGC